MSTQNTEERYLRAVNSGNLTVDPDHSCDADLLLAAGYVASGDPRKSLALDVYRMLATGNMAGVGALADRIGQMLVDRAYSRRNDINRVRQPRRQVQAIDPLDAVSVARTVLMWKHRSACPDCKGRGHPTFHNSPSIDESRECPTCKGSGVVPLERLVKQELADSARWVAQEIDSLCSIVFSDMLRARRNLLDL